MSEYEQMRDQESGPAGQAWREADRQEHELRNLYESLQNDPRFTEEYKAEKAWEAFTAKKDVIVSGRKKAREELEKQARSAERFSIPLPNEAGASPAIKDASELIAVQNEASRIREKVQRLQEINPLSGGDRAAPLREEYERGLELGGVEGVTICRAVLSATGDLGVPVDSVVDSFRKPRHRESQERAQAAQQAAFAIGTRIKEPPFRRPPGVAVGSLEGVFSSGDRKRAWK